MTDPSPVDTAKAHQATAADPALSVFVTANAGSGKTTTLVNRVARLLLKRVAPGAILCVTYTKAAAAEMQARLFDKLGTWAVADDDDLTRELAELDGRDPKALTGLELSEARRLFARALETPGGLKIQTIHAFCEKLLRRFPLEAGVQPGFEVLEDQAALVLSRTAREDLARAALADGDGRLGRAYAHFAVEMAFDAFNGLLDEIEAKREPLLDYVNRIDAGTAPDPHALVGLAPGERAEDIETDFMAWLNPADWLAAAQGFSGGSANDQKLAAQMRDAMPPGATLAAMTPIFIDSKGVARDKFGTAKAPPGAAAYLAEVSLKYLATLDRVRAARVADETEKALTLARVHAAYYEAAKRRRGALDFTDLVARTVDLLTQRASAAWVLYKLDGGVDHVLIDEAQDTAPDQWAIVRALTEPFFAGEGAERPGIARTLFAVGDEKQSIYSFQGARPERLREERRDYLALVENAGLAFAGPDLNTSFRSTEEVLTFVDETFASPERTRALVGETGDRLPHLPARQGQHGSVELWPLFEDPDKVERQAFDPVDKEDARSARKQLAQALARDIRRQVETGVAVWTVDKDRRPVHRPSRWGDFLILVRRRDATFEEIIRALKTEGVPVAGADRLKLKAHIVFDDLTALARFALYPEDDLSLAEILRGPLCDISDFGDPDSLFPLADRQIRKGGLWAELRQRAGEHPAWTEARDLMAALIAARDRDPFAFFCLALNRVGADGRSGRARILHRLGREAEEAIDETLAQVLAAEERGGRDLETCLALLEQADVTVKREMEGARNEVRVMTVHGAKGLEAPIVILPDTTGKAKGQGAPLLPVALDDAWGGGEAWLMAPSSKKEDCRASAEARQARQDRAEAEYLRLLYVALTRARDRLVVMGRRMKTPKEGFETGSWWDVIAQTFERLKAADTDAVHDIGDGRIRFGDDPGLASATASASTAPAAALPDWVARRPAPDRAAGHAAPSQIQGAIRIPAPSPLARSGPGGTLGRFRRGDLIHRLLERLPDAAPDLWPDLAQRLLARERDLDAAQRDEMIAAALGVLTDARFAPVFGPGSRAETAVTGSAPDLPPGMVVSGRIDRLVVTPERVLIVDYKTNRPAPDRVEDADPAYVLQLATYAAVLRRLYRDRPVEAALVWTDGPKLMAVPREMMDRTLADA
ncbi:MAG: double-strand break repair helicase AddA [Caulobacterales bacterium]|nr:double-strand break repair helicase AddA [Caulobacterales bacterium]